MLVLGLLSTGFYWMFSFEPISVRISSEENPVASEILISELKRLHRWTVIRGWLNDSGNGHVFKNELVQDLYQNPYAHFLLLKEQLGGAGLERGHKALWINLSQCLEPEDYVSLIDIALSSKLPAPEKSFLVRQIVSPSPYWGTAFEENFSAQPYKDTLEKILDDDEVAGSLETTIENLRSGTGKSFVETYRKAGEFFPRIACNP